MKIIGVIIVSLFRIFWKNKTTPSNQYTPNDNINNGLVREDNSSEPQKEMSDEGVNFSELMKWKGYIYLEELFEPEDNSLRLLINRSNLDYESESVEHLPMVQLDFDSYVSYSVINECFDSIDKTEISKGGIFRIYIRSRYLDFIKLTTNERDDICPSENYVHYQLPCLNHTIDVISCEEPKITVVTG